MPSLRRESDVFVLDLGNDENRFHPDWIAHVDKALDEVEAADGPKALVTSATGKFFSNGLDIEYLSANGERAGDYMASVHDLFARVLAFPVPTVAAIQGHCFGAAAMIAVAHDFRVMRSDRGYFCFPEVDLGMPFTPAMSALIQARLSPQAAHEAMTTSRRYGGDDALAAGIVQASVPESEVVNAAIAMAQPLAGKAGVALGIVKTTMYAAPLNALAAFRNTIT